MFNDLLSPTDQIKKILSLKENPESGELLKMILDFNNLDAPQIILICEKKTTPYQGTNISSFLLAQIKKVLTEEKKTIEIDFINKTIQPK
jgi:hypothetical protein